MAAGRKRGGQPGNMNAVKHGFYWQGFKPGEGEDLELLDGAGMQQEIDMLRILMRRLFQYAAQAEDPASTATTLESLANVSTTIAGLLKSQRMIEGGQSSLSDALSQALREVTGEFGCK
jgi:hypothetical protein